MKKYCSNINSPKVIMFLAIMCIFLFIATVIGKVREDNFPVYYEFINPVGFTIAVYAVLWIVALLMPITVKPEGIRDYALNGIHKEISWSQIDDAYFKRICGLPYIFVESSSLAALLTLPLYLKNMNGFKNTIVSYVGVNNHLSKALRSELRINHSRSL